MATINIDDLMNVVASMRVVDPETAGMSTEEMEKFNKCFPKENVRNAVNEFRKELYSDICKLNEKYKEVLGLPDDNFGITIEIYLKSCFIIEATNLTSYGSECRDRLCNPNPIPRLLLDAFQNHELNNK